MTQLSDCGNFTHHATSELKAFARENGLLWESWKKHFWIRKRDRGELFQGNYVTDGLRGLMHRLSREELTLLSQPKPYRSHPCGASAHRFYIKDDQAIDAVKQIIRNHLRNY